MVLANLKNAYSFSLKTISQSLQWILFTASMTGDFVDGEVKTVEVVTVSGEVTGDSGAG